MIIVSFFSIFRATFDLNKKSFSPKFKQYATLP